MGDKAWAKDAGVEVMKTGRHAGFWVFVLLLTLVSVPRGGVTAEAVQSETVRARSREVYVTSHGKKYHRTGAVPEPA